jgi:hypothetical protein
MNAAQSESDVPSKSVHTLSLQEVVAVAADVLKHKMVLFDPVKFLQVS